MYQIAIMARRDLDYAPDARAGFEMALLRMLAFQPAAQGDATPTVREESGRPAAVPARSTRTGGGGGKTRAPAAADDGDWASIVAALGLQGPASQLAAHCELVDKTAGLVRLRLDAAGEVYRRPQLVDKLAKALSEHFGQETRVDIAVSEALADTPARRQAVAAEERLKAAEQAIDGDPAVRAMRDVFGATVQPGSIKPVG
jgi:DNA polymerase-3 subunit gamma/tau